MRLFAIFVGTSLIEIILFIQIGGMIGLWPTLAIVVLTAAVGTWLVRSQGLSTLRWLQETLSELDNPTEPLAHGMMILVAGALLLTPGFFTDGIGLALLTPSVRTAAFRYLIRRYSWALRHEPDGSGVQPTDTHTDVIEVECEENSRTGTKSEASGWVRH